MGIHVHAQTGLRWSQVLQLGVGQKQVHKIWIPDKWERTKTCAPTQRLRRRSGAQKAREARDDGVVIQRGVADIHGNPILQGMSPKVAIEKLTLETATFGSF